MHKQIQERRYLNATEEQLKKSAAGEKNFRHNDTISKAQKEVEQLKEEIKR